MNLDPIVMRIDSADISANVYRTALRLLYRTHPDNGYVRVSHEQMAEICGTDKTETIRRHLADLAAADLITYRRNSAVHVHWHGWPTIADGDPVAYDPPAVPSADQPARAVRAKSTSQRAQDEQAQPSEGDTARAVRAKSTSQRAQDLTNDDSPRAVRAKSTSQRAGPIRTRERALVGCLFDDPFVPDSDQTTNHGGQNASEPPGFGEGSPPDPGDQARTVSLLVDPAVHVSVKRARELAARRRFEFCRRIVAMYWDKLQSGLIETGKIIQAIEDEYGAPVLSEAFMRTDFYRRHRTPEEVAADDDADDDAAQRQTDEARAGPPPAATSEEKTPPPGSPEAYWYQVRKELEIEQGGTFDRWLDGTFVEYYDPDTNTFGIALPDATRVDWIRHRLAKQIQRKLTVITSRTAMIEFIIPETREARAQDSDSVTG